MKHDATLPTEEQIDSLIDRLLPANEDMDTESASIILEREGYDRPRLAAALKIRVERRVAGMRERGEDVPPQLLSLIARL